MKTFTSVAILSAAAVASAQITYNNQTNTYTCAKPGQAYCAGPSLGTDIIIRCDATGKGQPGRCSDNLAGQPPYGVKPALCYQTSDITGDAACEKNCVVYGGSGNFHGTTTLPADLCVPTYTASSSSLPGTGVSTSASQSTTLTTIVGGSTTTITTDCSGPTDVPPPSGTGGSGSGSGTGISPPLGTGSGSGSGGLSNSTVTIIPPPTKTPVGPTTTGSGPTNIATAGAAANRVGGAIAAIGLVAAYLL